MFTEINARLVEIQGELRKKDKYKKQLEDYKQELRQIEERIFQLQDEFDLEQKDVEKLERISLANLFATLSGTKEEKLTQEKQELFAVQLKLEEAEKTKKEIDEDMLEIRNKLFLLKEVEHQHQELLKEKENMIKASSSPLSEKVLELSEKEGALEAYLKELDEAITAGKRVERALVDAIRSFEKAENWGTFDMFGGGTISGVAKHQNINQAETYLHQAQRSMRHFQKELLDVKEVAQIKVDISGMLKFADFFFDGFIADFLVQGKITRSLEQTRNHYAKVNDILRELKAQSEERLKELDVIRQEKQELVDRV